MTFDAPPAFFLSRSCRSFSRAAISPRLCGQATAAASATAAPVKSERVSSRIDASPPELRPAKRNAGATGLLFQIRDGPLGLRDLLLAVFHDLGKGGPA